MRVLTLTELMRLTPTELCDLLTQITSELPAFPEARRARQRAHEPTQHSLGTAAARILALSLAVSRACKACAANGFGAF